MDRDFWLERWDNQQIGFHQPKGQPLLHRFWPTLELAEDAPVLVPLCGKTPDMAWLASRGHSVTGIEFSERAAADFFDEQRIPRETTDEGPFRHISGQGVELYVGDFFAYPVERIARFGAVYDRAALIALPPELRADYAKHLLDGLAPGARILLITLDYDQQEMSGPPFAVGDSEVHRLYGDRADIACVSERSGLSRNDHLRARGLTQACERVYCITRNADR
ncbi:thiopurine S-methyltransferase [Salinisphaera sp. T31B1]|uniref:thiopurine S-methyltransferase n=1 Tax=Salinisphaera sp. T31B1 TaxID=727963 RepID=UPI0033429DD1